MNGPQEPPRETGLDGRLYFSPTATGFVLIAVVVARALISYRERPALPAVLLLLASFVLLYVLQMALPVSLRRLLFVYFPLQMAVIMALSSQKPFLDVVQILYIPLALQARHALRGRQAMPWLALFALALNATVVLAMGWLDGLAFSLVMMAACAFLFSYEGLSARMQRERDKSQRLLAELQRAHQQLTEHAGRAEALAAAQERNRLARELHDSVSQSIFAITLTSQATRQLLEREPGRVPEQLDRLQGMTGAALSQLRALIAQLHPPTG